MNEHLQLVIKKLPTAPGVYQFYDKEDKLLYVGKAKNIRNRVRSYFTNKKRGAKTELLVRKIESVKFTVVHSEHEALLLENNFIKAHQPRYNIQLKDDKTYPYICIKKEPVPRVLFIRNRILDGSEYYGPYTSTHRVRKVMNIITTLFPLRTCKLNLSAKNIESKKYSVCLEYHIGNCLGPCVGHQSTEEYDHSIQQIRNILQGKTHIVLKYLKEKIQEYAGQYEFEKAHDYQNRVKALELYRENNIVANIKIEHVDVYHILRLPSKTFVSFMKVKNGAVVGTQMFELKNYLNEADEELLKHVIFNQTVLNRSGAKEVISPIPVDIEAPIKVHVPKRGEKLHLLKLSYKNLLAQKQHYISISAHQKENPSSRILKQLQQDLKLRDLPVHIECFDNSNIQGNHPVASCVVFKNGKPSKKDYRHFNIKQVVGIDDFASMQEVVYRRYNHLLNEKLSFPNLIVIDGGKGQLNAALSSLKKLGIEKEIPIISIAKKLEEIYYPNDPYPLHINKKSESLKLIQQLRNEAHRFAISFHRKKRSNALIETNLTSVKGIGEKTATLLLKTYGSVKKMRQVSIKELASLIGQSKAENVYEFLHQPTDQ